MLRLNEVQRILLKSVLVKILWLPAMWFFFWAIYPLAYPRDFIIYLMLSLYNYLCCFLSIVGAAILEILVSDPSMRARLRAGLKLQRGERKEPTSKTSKEAGKSAKKEEKLPLW